MKKVKRAITLIEIIIVIALISLIGSALAINMKGSLDKGRAFKTEQNIERIRNILILEMDNGEDGETIAKEWETHVKSSPLVKASDVMRDGWGKEFKVTYLKGKDDFKIRSDRYQKYLKEHEPKKDKIIEEEDKAS